MQTPTPQISQYLGRTVDLAAFDGMLPDGRDTLLSQALVQEGETGALVTGTEKLAQRFLVELLTDRGSLRYLPKRGTTFMIEARRGLWRTTTDVEQSFYGAMLTIESNLISEENVDDPLDEKYGSANILAVSVVADLVVLRIILQSLAGISREILYPLRVNSIGA